MLRPWRDEDLAPFARLNADPEVMAHFPATLTREQSDALAHRLRAYLEQRGWGFWAVEVPGIAPFIGFVGLSEPGFAAPFTPCTEVGWRLARAFWGQGYANEAAAASLDHGFGALGLREVVSFTVPANRRSVAVMERLGMRRSPEDDFPHPSLPQGHPLQPHLLYRMSAANWTSRRRSPPLDVGQSSATPSLSRGELPSTGNSTPS